MWHRNVRSSGTVNATQKRTQFCQNKQSAWISMLYQVHPPFLHPTIHSFANQMYVLSICLLLCILSETQQIRRDTNKHFLFVFCCARFRCGMQSLMSCVPMWNAVVTELCSDVECCLHRALFRCGMQSLLCRVPACSFFPLWSVYGSSLIR